VRYEFHSEALQEYEDAARYYEACENGLGLRFTESVESAIRIILEDPARRRIFEKDIRRCLTRVFPYAVLYSIEPDYILIIAVMHCHREPGYWRHRVKSS
jgi:toxin ParE1/3/4